MFFSQFTYNVAVLHAALLENVHSLSNKLLQWLKNHLWHLKSSINLNISKIKWNQKYVVVICLWVGYYRDWNNFTDIDKLRLGIVYGWCQARKKYFPCYARVGGRLIPSTGFSNSHYELSFHCFRYLLHHGYNRSSCGICYWRPIVTNLHRLLDCWSLNVSTWTHMLSSTLCWYCNQFTKH